MSQSLNIIKDKLEELPNNIEAEQSVIGSILLSNEIFDEISILISSKNFYDPMHQKIFSAIESLIYNFANSFPLIYGFTSLIIALIIGWISADLFRRFRKA